MFGLEIQDWAEKKNINQFFNKLLLHDPVLRSELKRDLLKFYIIQCFWKTRPTSEIAMEAQSIKILDISVFRKTASWCKNKFYLILLWNCIILELNHLNGT